MSRLVPIDFEYHSSNEFNLHLVCCSLLYDDKVYEFWLNDKSDSDKLKDLLKEVRNRDYIVVAFNVEAEARSLLSLNLDVRKFKWIDIQVEYKMLLNHNHKFMYGKQYKNGKETTTYSPRSKYAMSEREQRDIDASKPKSNLVACTYKLLGKLRDSDHKDKMRDIILTKDFDLIEANRKQIQDYCTDDIHDLIPLWDKIKEEYRAYFVGNIEHARPTIKEILYRGDSVARTALITRIGYPIQRTWLTNLSLNIPKVTADLKEDINSQFDWELFGKSKTNRDGYKQNQNEWKEYILTTKYADKWMKTDKDSVSLSEKAFKNFSFRHDFPRGNFFAQALRYIKTSSALRGFDRSTKKATIYDSLGPDDRVRPYINPYGSQSARYQPKSTSYLLLKTAWTRSLLHPKEGRVIVSIDYKSEEALIGALEANDTAMLQAYESGDVYLDYAKRAGAIPQEGTKEDYKKERDLFKATYLGISYLMGPKSLSEKLTDDTGKKFSQADAQKLIDKFYSAYPSYKEYLDKVYKDYQKYGYLKLFDGWIMFGDNDNFRSVSNMPIQGMGSCILRKAIKYTQDSGLDLVAPLHDALYIECDIADVKEATDTLAKCMTDGFVDCYPNNPKAKLIRLDIEAWGDGLLEQYGSNTIKTNLGNKIELENIHIDSRGKAEYLNYSQYFKPITAKLMATQGE